MSSSISIILWAMNTPIWVTGGTERLVFSILSASRVREKLKINLEQGSSLGCWFFSLRYDWCWYLWSSLLRTPGQILYWVECHHWPKEEIQVQISETENSAQIQIWDFVGNGPFSSFDKHTLRRDYIRGIQNYSFWARATTALRFWKYLERWTFEGSEMEK